MAIEKLIFDNLLHNELYARKTLPFLKVEYFSNRENQILFNIIEKFIVNYNNLPTKECLEIELDKLTNISETEFTKISNMISELNQPSGDTVEWLVDQTEQFCQDRAIINAITKSISIIDGKAKEDKGAIPELLADALAVSFDSNIGHDFLEDVDTRFEFYHKVEEKLPFDIEYLNKITKGGLPKKSLTCFIAPTGVGKSLVMCHMAASNLALGKNVLYITLEMAEERIAERIDANLLNVTIDDLQTMPKEAYDKKIERLKNKTKGKLIIKEYPTACAGSNNFRHLLNELKLKKKFIPDIIYIDYLNLCVSSRIKAGAAANTYVLIKSIAEEIRGLAVEQNVPIVTATQTNREGLSTSDMMLENTSESIGLPATLDLFIAIMQPEEMANLNQYLFKQLKNRYNDLNINKRFVIGVDKSRMKLYDVEQSAQNLTPDDSSNGKPVMDNTTFGARFEGETKPKFDKDRFENLF